MSIKLTREQAKRASRAYGNMGGDGVEFYSNVANALVAMGVVVESTAPPPPGPTIEQRLAATEDRLASVESKSLSAESKHITTLSTFGLHNQRLAALEAKANRPASDSSKEKEDHKSVAHTSGEADSDRLEWLAEQGFCWRDHDTVDKGWKPGEWLYRCCSMNFRAELDRHRSTLEAKANRPISEPFVPTDPHADKKEQAKLWRIVCQHYEG